MLKNSRKNMIYLPVLNGYFVFPFESLFVWTMCLAKKKKMYENELCTVTAERRKKILQQIKGNMNETNE